MRSAALIEAHEEEVAVDSFAGLASGSRTRTPAVGRGC